jgi:cytochrome bd-type quinol oxidase subunit 2
MLGIVAFIAIFVMTYYAYKTAKDYERNAVVWALVVFSVGFGLQIVIPFIIAIVIAIVMVTNGTPPEQVEASMSGSAIVITLVFIILSVVAMFLILRYISNFPEDDVSAAAPPPPTFDGS